MEDVATALGQKIDFTDVVREISTDTRTIEKGDLFVALKGENFDGSKFVDSAIKSGAITAVVDSDYKGDNKVILVENTIDALQKICGEYRNKFSPYVIGVTGSVGKTTTKDLAAVAMQTAFTTIKTPMNLNNEIGTAKTLLTIDKETQAIVLELGMADFGEIDAMAKMAKPDIGIVTNIGISHIETLGSRENICKAKLEIANGIKEGGCLILNADDDMMSGAKLDFEGKILWYGIDSKDCDIFATDIVTDFTGSSFCINYKENKYNAYVPAVGKHIVLDCLAAFGAGITCGIDPQLVADSFKNYLPSGMRQNVTRHNEYTVIEDCYNASPDSLKAAVNALLEFEGRKIVVFGDMLELGDYSVSGHSLVGEYISNKEISHLFCYGDHSKYAAKSAGTEVVAKFFEDKRELFENLKEILQPGDNILVKGSRGMKMEEIINWIYGEC